MNIEELTRIGGVIASKPIKKQITWERVMEDGSTDEQTFDVFVRKLTYGDQETMIERAGLYRIPTEDDTETADPQQPSINAALISIAVGLGEGGSESLTYEQALSLDPPLAKEMLRAVTDVNPAPKKKASTRKKSSGTSSS